MNLNTAKYGLVLGLILSTIIILSNVVFPNNGPDYAPGMLLVALVIGIYIIWSAHRGSHQDKKLAPKIGAITSVLGFSISMLTFAIIDNVFLSTVSKQADKIAGFQHSSYHSMQAFINAGLVRGFVVGVPASIVFGLVCGWIAKLSVSIDNE